MKRKHLLFCLFCGLFISLQAQSNLMIDQSYTVEEMVMDFFNHPDITITNVTYTGSGAAYGFFDSGDPAETALEVGAGIFIGTGDAVNAIGPNTGQGITGNMNSGSDTDLTMLAGGFSGTQDAAVISFDLTASSTLFLDFNYVFGSEEYCEFVNSSFNDVFGFFVSGAGINGPFSNNGINIATVPGAADYVGINSINHLMNTDLFLPNSFNCNGLELDPLNLQYDGITTALNASFSAFAGETYHIRLGVADVSDSAFDSGVFLSFNSLSMDSVLVPPAQFSASNIFTNGAVFTNESKYATSYLWDFGNGMTSTEKNPGAIMYASAGTYEVSLTTQNYCCTDVFTQMVTVQQVALSSVAVIHNSPLLCYGDENASVDLEIIGGVPPYNIDWSSGIVSPTDLAAGFYEYTVTDSDGASITGSIAIESPEEILGEMTSTEDIDQQSNGSLEIEVTGGSIPYTYQWSTGATTTTNVLGNLSAGAYTVTVSDNNGCTAVFGGDVEAFFSPMSISTTTVNNPLACAGDANAGVLLDITGGQQPYNVSWTPAAPDLMSLSAGEYNIVITDAMGSTISVDVLIEAPEPLLIDVPGLMVTNETQGQSDGVISISGIGGTAPYTYEWINGATTPTIENLSAGEYAFTIVDSQGCILTGSVTVNEMLSGVLENNDFTFQLFPNPATDHLTLIWSETAAIESLIVYDVLGNTVVVNYNHSGNQISIDFENRPASGAYYLEVVLKDGRRGVERFMVR